MWHRRHVGWILPLLLALSCAPKRADIGVDLSRAPAPYVLKRIFEQRALVRTVVGKGNLSFDSPEAAGSAFFRLALKRPESLLVKLQGPFGMSVGTFFLSRSRFVMYNAMENSVIAGTPDARGIRSVVPFDITADEVFNLFGGCFPLPSDTTGLREMLSEDGLLHFKFACGRETCDFWVDAEDLLVTKLRRENSSGDVLVEAEADDIHEFNGVPLPRRIRLSFPQTSRYLSIYYSSLSVNQEDPSFVFSVPPGARVRTP